MKLTAKGKHKSASDTVTITVEGMTELPEVLAQYDFEEGNLDASKKTVKDISGSGIDAEQKGKVETAEGRDGGQGISMDGEVGGYVKLSDGLTRYTKETTIAMDVKLKWRTDKRDQTLNLVIWKKICFMLLLKVQMNYL